MTYRNPTQSYKLAEYWWLQWVFKNLKSIEKVWDLFEFKDQKRRTQKSKNQKRQRAKAIPSLRGKEETSRTLSDGMHVWVRREYVKAINREVTVKRARLQYLDYRTFTFLIFEYSCSSRNTIPKHESSYIIRPKIHKQEEQAIRDVVLKNISRKAGPGISLYHVSIPECLVESNASNQQDFFW